MKRSGVNVSLTVRVCLLVMGVHAYADVSPTFLKGVRRCVVTCLYDCLCVHPPLVKQFCVHGCEAKCARCIFIKCHIHPPSTSPRPAGSCAKKAEKWVPGSHYFCTLGCATSLYNEYVISSNDSHSLSLALPDQSIELKFSGKIAGRLNSCTKACTKNYSPGKLY